MEIVQAVKKLNSILRERLNFWRRPVLCTTLYRNPKYKRATSVAHLTNFSFELFLWNFHTKCPSNRRYAWDKTWRGMRPGLVTALCISYAFSDCIRTFASCFICSGVQLTWIFFFWLCFETPLHSCKCVYLPESEKVSLWNSYKSERESSVHH